MFQPSTTIPPRPSPSVSEPCRLTWTWPPRPHPDLVGYCNIEYGRYSEDSYSYEVSAETSESTTAKPTTTTTPTYITFTFVTSYVIPLRKRMSVQATRDDGRDNHGHHDSPDDHDRRGCLYNNGGVDFDGEDNNTRDEEGDGEDRRRRV